MNKKPTQVHPSKHAKYSIWSWDKNNIVKNKLNKITKLKFWTNQCWRVKLKKKPTLK